MKVTIFLIIFSTLFGCANYYARATYEFEEIDSNVSIYYDEGAEDIANKVADSITNSIDIVSKSLYVEFKNIEEIKIYIFEDKSRYAKFSGASEKTRGSATKNEIYISPVIRDRIDTLPLILIHELAHVHLRQYIGTWDYWVDVPGWFHEGLAVEVSKGGGAEKITDEQAYKAILAGKHFTPRESSGILGHKYAHDYGIDPQLYYRQAGLFIRFLKDKNPAGFESLYLALINGASSKGIWELYFGNSLAKLWNDFLEGINA
ncbi:MAG: hypothetical protein CL866_08185 [Cycloclasticus sp.]|nr:hypothetical protein [Cycloclasticus sp.]MBG96822.1 hypothetical protein [Cycloclasticus sp.]HAI96789.1 hypothetical protein [Methylococcaceae bacterium]|tara:strand:+ start:1290 stop:2072 length:783 start_codon:yes stop_codon:yes gene_type:complete